MKKTKNRRKFIRSNISIATRLTPSGAPSINAIAIDLSMSGILVQTDATLEIGSKCHVSMLIGHYMHELPISAEGVVARVQKGIIAICFNAIGIDVSKEFESMILFHSNDPKRCLLEFEESKAS